MPTLGVVPEKTYNCQMKQLFKLLLEILLWDTYQLRQQFCVVGYILD